MHTLQTDIQTFIGDKAFPCVGAKTALNGQDIDLCVAGSLFSDSHDRLILRRIKAYSEACQEKKSQFRSFIVCFPETEAIDELQFEKGLWQRLSALHALDESAWDPAVSSDPDSKDFSYSLGGEAFYIVGLHPQSGRKARRFKVPTLVFNLHEQFERLRKDGSYHTMRQIIRRRDRAFSGSTNPMLDDFGQRSEACQYSGRETQGPWACPFHARHSETHAKSAHHPA